MKAGIVLHAGDWNMALGAYREIDNRVNPRPQDRFLALARLQHVLDQAKQAVDAERQAVKAELDLEVV